MIVAMIMKMKKSINPSIISDVSQRCIIAEP